MHLIEELTKEQAKDILPMYGVQVPPDAHVVRVYGSDFKEPGEDYHEYVFINEYGSELERIRRRGY